jgi:hypothetical protein
MVEYKVCNYNPDGRLAKWTCKDPDFTPSPNSSLEIGLNELGKSDWLLVASWPETGGGNTLIFRKVE